MVVALGRSIGCARVAVSAEITPKNATNSSEPINADIRQTRRSAGDKDLVELVAQSVEKNRSQNRYRADGVQFSLKTCGEGPNQQKRENEVFRQMGRLADNEVNRFESIERYPGKNR